MSVDWREIAFPFVGGLDTKADDRALAPPKLALLENGIFTDRGSVKKRNGYTATRNEDLAGTSITTGRQLLTRDDELLLFNDSKIYSYADGIDRWIDKGAIECPVVTLGTVAKVVANQTYADRATANGITVYAWEDSRDSRVHYSIVNNNTGAAYYNDQDLGASTTHPKVVAVDGILHILHRDSANGKIKTKKISPGDLAGSVSTAATDVTTDLRASNPVYDAIVSGQRIILAYSDSGGTSAVKVRYVSAGGSPEDPVTIAINTTAIGLALVPDGRVVMATRSTAGAINIRLLSSALSDLANSDLDTGITADNIAVAVEATPQSGTASNYKAQVFWEVNAASDRNRIVKIRSYITDAGTLGTAVTMRHSALVSKAWADGTNVYAMIVHDSTLQSTYFAMRHDGLLVAKILPGVSGGVTGGGTNKAHLGQVEAIGDREFAWAGIYKTRLDVKTTATSTPGTFTEKGIKDITLDFNHAHSHRGAQVGRTLYIGGGFLWQYDGQGAVEAGFHIYPENVTSATATTGGSMAAGVYNYRVYWEWTNAKGERELSTTYSAVAVDISASATSTNTITLTIPTLAQTAKTSPRPEVSIAVYRTEANPTEDAPFYRVSSPDPSASGNNGYKKNDPTSDTVTFTDAYADASIISQELDYQNTGELDNVSPLGGHIIAAGENRIFLAGFEDPNLILYSKLHYSGEAVSFNDANTAEADEEGGPITGLAMLNESLVIFKRRRIYILVGEGPNNLGIGQFNPISLVTSDAGCTNQRSIVTTPRGLMFQSEKGIYLLTQQLSLEYVGSDVEAYNSQTYVAATLLGDTNQVRFLTSSGKSLIYDYLFGQWGTFTNHEGVGATIWRNPTTDKDVYCYVTSSGQVRQESTTAFQDVNVPYKLRMETAWIRVSALQGFQRVRRATVLGEFKSDHDLKMEVAYNYEPVYTAIGPWDVAGIVNTSTWGSGTWGSGVWGGSGESAYQVRGHMPKQKCEAIKFRFEDVFDGTYGESYQLTELALEVGVKKGPYKLRSEKTIG